MTRLELGIAWRYLRSRRGSRLLSFITVIAVGGVVVGVSALILIIAVMNGLQYDLRESILVGSPDVRVLTLTSDLRMKDWRTVLRVVGNQDGVVAAAPFVTTRAMIKSANTDIPQFAQIVGLDPQTDEFPEVLPVRRHLITGAFDYKSADPERPGVVLGYILASNLQMALGDTLQVFSLESIRSDAVGGLTVQPFRGELTGAIKSGMFDYDNSYVYMNLAEAQKVAGLGDDITGIEVRTPDRWSATRVAENIAAKLDPSLYRVETWQQQNAALFSALQLEKLAMAIILALIIIVAAFNIVSVLTMMVNDKTREIGILRAMGMTSRSVRRIFIAQGVFIGLVGTSIGLFFGLVLSFVVGYFELIPLEPAIYFIDHLPVRTEIPEVVLIALGSVLIATLATIYPANQAARLYPLDAIRHE